jgi:diguanylate cyclase (GGDEF)-like protein
MADEAATQNHIRPEEVFAQLTGFQHALATHVDWLRRWYGALVNRDQSETSGDDCTFPHWVENAGMFATFDSFGAVVSLHAEVHCRADEISARAAGGEAATTSDYEALVQSVIAFGSAAQALEREAWTILATVDPLTGLSNRQSMRAQLMRERDRTIRMRQPCCLALVDIDHFKKINDNFGHAQGDRVLRAVASLLMNAVRPYDVVYRYGGEEFLLCLPGTDARGGTLVAERIRSEIAELRITADDGAPIPVTATIGLSVMDPRHAIDDTIEQADKALYDGKRNGRNQVVVHPMEAV